MGLIGIKRISMSYKERTKGSLRLYERAQRVLPAGVSYQLRDITPHPFYVRKAQGVKLTDVDGNVYTDYWVGHGALILGHSPKQVVDAVARQLPNGTHYGFCHELEIELAERVVDMMPSAEMVRYTSSGTEANLYATRLARAYTGRMKMLKIEGGWHGGYDSLHMAVHAPFNVPESAGLNPKTVEDTSAVPFNDLEAARKALKLGDKACLIIEPVMGAGGFITPEPGYLEGLREICDDTGTLLMFDEVITGFRLAPGGAQEYYGVKPDVSTIGKILGGGFPVGALVGRRDVFERINHKKYPGMQERSAQGGTFTGNPISMTAGIATLDALKDGKVYKKIGKLGGKMSEGLREIAGRYSLHASVIGVASCFALHFRPKPPRNARETADSDGKAAKAFYEHMLSSNIAFMTPSVCHAWICEPHTEKDVGGFLAAAEEFFKNYKG